MKASVWTLLVCFLGAYTVACLIHFLAFLAVWWRKKTSPTSIVRELSRVRPISRSIHLPLQWDYGLVGLGLSIAYRVSRFGYPMMLFMD